MKKLYSWAKRALVMALAIVAASTTNAFAATEGDPEMIALLREIVKEVNAELPAELGDGIIMNKLYLSKGRMVYDFLLPADGLELFMAFYEEDSEEFEAMMIGSMLEDNEEVLILFAVCVEAEYGLELKFSDYDRDNSFSIIWTHHDMKPLLGDLDIYDILESWMEY